VRSVPQPRSAAGVLWSGLEPRLMLRHVIRGSNPRGFRAGVGGCSSKCRFTMTSPKDPQGRSEGRKKMLEAGLGFGL
jgi:hypothetical protein